MHKTITWFSLLFDCFVLQFFWYTRPGNVVSYTIRSNCLVYMCVFNAAYSKTRQSRTPVRHLYFQSKDMSSEKLSTTVWN